MEQHPTNYDRAEEIQTLFWGIVKDFRSFYVEKAKIQGYTTPQLLLMKKLYDHPQITLQELSNMLGLSKSTVSGIVDRLEAQGTVTRIRDTKDRRTVKISLTPKMLELKDSLNILETNYLADLLNEVDQEEVEKIISGLKKLNRLMTANKNLG
jgi:MarR family transcriptional regulator, organic hydroperoxide resistance regulator